ncbi:MAG: CoA transferase [Sphingobium sp.]
MDLSTASVSNSRRSGRAEDRTSPLEGILVVSVEQAVAAPGCTRAFADRGACIVEIKRPQGGDFARSHDRREACADRTARKMHRRSDQIAR